MNTTIEKSPVTFDIDPPDHFASLLSVRPAVLVRWADLEKYSLLGLIRDVDGENPSEAGITYGIMSAAQLQTVENDLRGSLDRIFDSGQLVESVCRLGRMDGSRVLLWIRTLRTDGNLRQFSYVNDSLPEQVMAGRAVHEAAMRKRHEAALALRKSFVLADLTSRAAVPGWLTPAAIEIVLDSSTYAALPATADEASGELSPKARR